MARDPKPPLTFFLPDNDVVSLVTWDYIADKLTDALNPLVSSLESTNESLKVINDKLESLLSKDEE